MKKTFFLLLALVFNFSVFAEVHVVIIRDFQYDPASLVIVEGDVVRFEWEQGFHPTASTTGEWATFTLDATTSSKEITFNAAGEYDYYCTAHGSPTAGMNGTITVETVTGFVPVASGEPKVYPNPAIEKVNIDLNGLAADQFQVKSLCGHTVKADNISGSSVQLNLPEGEYLLLFLSKGEIIETKKLIVGK